MATWQDIIDSVAHKLGATPDPSMSVYRVINHAGRILFQMHPWRWLGAVATLDAVAAQPYLVLPADFGTLKQAVIPAGGLLNELVTITLAEYMDLLKTTTTPTGCVWICWDGWTPPASDALPTPPDINVRPTRRALVYPTPTSNAEWSILCHYRRRWVDVSAASITPTASPPMPTEWDRLFELIVRECAMQLHEEQPSIDGESIAAELARLKEYEGATPADLGPIRGGVRQRVGNRDPRVGEITWE